jgi:hypothetical protein
VLKEKPHLRKCLTRCRHCRILFFTHPRNAGRNDLRCPFGCQQAYRKENSTKRSVEYYRSKEGKIKKKYLNARRNGRLAESRPEENSAERCGPGIDKATVHHIRTVTSLIQERPVTIKEVIFLIIKILRQHSMDKRKKRFYAAVHHHNSPP